jgi:glycosyltransferase involved in cell wall biosynthesis
MSRAQKASVVVVHERYQQFGGEDVAVEADLALLETNGHRVEYYERHNDEIKDLDAFGRFRLAAGTVWSGRSRKALADILDRHRPDVLHAHNTFPLLSPSIYGAARIRGVPVVQSVHNYRLVCATGALLRDGRLCNECVGRLPLPAVRHGCYHASRPQSAVVASMLAVHRGLRTWDRDVDLFLPVSRHVLHRLTDAGAIPPERAVVRTNHLSPDPGLRPPGSDEGYAVFVGRLSREKGVDVLVEAAARVPELAVRIVGDGPERDRVVRLARDLQARNIDFLGSRPRAEVLDIVRRARCFVLPSVWEEPMGLVLLEAAALGVPVIGSNIGGTPEVVIPGTGILFPPADVGALAAVLRDAVAHPSDWQLRGRAARRHFEESFTADIAYRSLLGCYERVAATAGGPPTAASYTPA